MAQKSLLTTLLFLTFEVLNLSGAQECCPDPNIFFISNESCSTETEQEIKLDCPTRIPIDRSGLDSSNYNILDNGSLIDHNDRIIHYCHSTDGDDPTASNNIYIICFEPTSEQQFDDSKAKVQAILIFVSTFFVLLTIIAYSIVPNLLDLQGICIMHMLGGLASGYLFLGMLQIDTGYSDVTCKALPYLFYFSFFYLFFWLLTLSFHIWRITVKPHWSRGTVQWNLAYHLFGIGGPILALFIILAAHYSPAPMWENIRPGFGERNCWFKSDKETLIYLYGPLIVLLLGNVIFYLWTVISLWKQVESTRSKVLKYRLKLCVRLCIIMGITWVFEIFAFFVNPYVNTILGKTFLFLMDLVNALQGILIFLVLVVFRKRFRRALANKNPCGLQLPYAWKFLEDEEMESAERKVNETVVEYNNDIKITLK